MKISSINSDSCIIFGPLKPRHGPSQPPYEFKPDHRYLEDLQKQRKELKKQMKTVAEGEMDPKAKEEMMKELRVKLEKLDEQIHKINANHEQPNDIAAKDKTSPGKNGVIDLLA